MEVGGIRCFDLPLNTKSELSPRLWRALPSVVSLVKKERFDLLHAHTRVTQVLAASVSRLTGLPYISTAHGFYKGRWGRGLFPCWGRRVVAVSSVVAQDLEKTHGVSPDKITVVHNALDIEDLERRFKSQDKKKNRSELGIPEGGFVLGCVSRLVRDKGHEYLVLAIREMVSRIPGIFLVIVGDGREKKNLEDLVKKHMLKDHVSFVPGLNDTTKVLSVIDVFAHPATFREGFGLSMAEAMIAKIPVLATTIPAIDTIFQNNVTALLVPPKDAESLAKAIQRLAEDRALASAIAQNGHALALKLCQSQRQAEEMERVYESVLKP